MKKGAAVTEQDPDEEEGNPDMELDEDVELKLLPL